MNGEQVAASFRPPAPGSFSGSWRPAATQRAGSHVSDRVILFVPIEVRGIQVRRKNPPRRTPNLGHHPGARTSGQRPGGSGEGESMALLERVSTLLRANLNDLVEKARIPSGC